MAREICSGRLRVEELSFITVQFSNSVPPMMVVGTKSFSTVSVTVTVHGHMRACSLMAKETCMVPLLRADLTITAWYLSSRQRASRGSTLSFTISMELMAVDLREG